VAVAQVPESVAFSFVALVDPVVGLYATFFMGIITALIGGRPGMVSGAAGAMAVVAVRIMEPDGLLPQAKLLEWGEIASCTGAAAGCKSLRHQANAARLEWLFMIMILCGVLQIVLGIVQAGRLMRLIPQTVMTGFVNGLAIIIFKAQLEVFKEKDWQAAFNVFDSNRDGLISTAEVTTVYAVELPDLSTSDLNAYVAALQTQVDTDSSGTITLAEFSANKNADIHGGYEDSLVWRTLDEGTTWLMLFYVFTSMAIVHFLPKYTKILPSSLVAILWCLLLEHAINRPLIHADTPVVSDAAPVKVDFPLYHTPNVNLTGKSFAHVFGITFSLAAVGLIESVLTLQCVDEILDDTSDATGRFTQECIAQGIANTMSGMFKAMGGDAMIGQSQINVKSGGVGRLSTAFASIMFLIFIVAASKVIELIPLAALTGVLFMIVIYTFDWTCLPLMSGDLKGLIIGRKEDGTREDYAGRRLRKFWFDTNDRIRWKDSAIIILVTVVTERTNLAIAVGVGVVVACLFYAWDNSTGSLRVIRREEEIFGCEKGTTRVAYEVYGELFFGTDREFTNSFRMGPDPRDVVIYMDKCKIKDYSSLAALNSLYVRYADVGKTIRVHNTDPDNRALMDLLGEKFLPQVIDEDLSVSGVSHVVLELAHAKRKASVEKFEDS
jgi:MFS superfamily sulfate permease-like transporter